jgi:erythronate-4-phosphate dehydrogenase
MFVKIVADQNIPHVAACFSHLGEVTLFNGREITPAAVAEADVLLVRSVTKVNEALLAKSSIKFVATATIGIEHVDVSYLESRGMGFASAPGSNAMSVADWVTAVLLTLGEKYAIDLAASSIGIIGVGNVGSRVVCKCAGLGMRTVLNDPPLARQTGEDQYQPLEDVYGCDFVTVHTPLTHDGEDMTYHLADIHFFERLKPGALFINAARGGVHDTAGLQVALESGHLRAAALDVWENEPEIDPALLRLVDIATPHIAGYSLDGKIAGLLMIYQAVCQYFNLTAEHQARDFLPEPEIKMISLTPSAAPLQRQVFDVVRQVYPIARDDARTREILGLAPAERAAYFDSLRKNYPVRREFHNTSVTGEASNDALTKILAGIGFQTES